MAGLSPVWLKSHYFGICTLLWCFICATPSPVGFYSWRALAVLRLSLCEHNLRHGTANRLVLCENSWKRSTGQITVPALSWRQVYRHNFSHSPRIVVKSRLQRGVFELQLLQYKCWGEGECRCCLLFSMQISLIRFLWNQKIKFVMQKSSKQKRSHFVHFSSVYRSIFSEKVFLAWCIISKRCSHTWPQRLHHKTGAAGPFSDFAACRLWLVGLQSSRLVSRWIIGVLPIVVHSPCSVIQYWAKMS